MSNYNKSIDSKELLSSYHLFLKNVTIYLKELKTNVAIAEIMSFVNILKQVEEIPIDIWSGFLQVLAPFAPHIAEELWYELYNFDKNDPQKSIHLTAWPKYQEELCIKDRIVLAIQVNGKIRGEIEIIDQDTEEDILNKAKQKVSKYLVNKTIKFYKIIPNKLITLATN